MVIDKLLKNNIEVRPIVTGNFTKNPVIKYMDYEITGNLVNANYIHENGFFVGNHSTEINSKMENLFNVLN